MEAANLLKFEFNSSDEFFLAWSAVKTLPKGFGL